MVFTWEMYEPRLGRSAGAFEPPKVGPLGPPMVRGRRHHATPRAPRCPCTATALLLSVESPAPPSVLEPEPRPFLSSEPALLPGAQMVPIRRHIAVLEGTAPGRA